MRFRRVDGMVQFVGTGGCLSRIEPRIQGAEARPFSFGFPVPRIPDIFRDFARAKT